MRSARNRELLALVPASLLLTAGCVTYPTVMDVGGRDVLSVAITNDKDLRRPRPLMMTADPGGVRLYAGKDYVVIAAK